MSTWSDLQVGNFRVGRLTVDPTMLRGEGGALSPALVVPFTLRLEPRPEGEAIAVTVLEADLMMPTDSGEPVSTVIGSPAVSTPVGMVGGIWCTIPSAANDWQLVFRFPLTGEQVLLLERHATQLASGAVPVDLRLRFGSAWVRPSEASSAGTRLIPPALGTSTWDLQPFAETRAEPTTLHIPRDLFPKLLANLGARAVRLIPVRLRAASGGLGAPIAEAFEAATRAFDRGEYRQSVQCCRDIREAVESSLEAANGVRVADRVAERLGWGEDSPSRELLENLWKSLIDVSSAANHRRGRLLSAADARLTVLLTASLLDYLGELLVELDPIASA